MAGECREGRAILVFKNIEFLQSTTYLVGQFILLNDLPISCALECVLKYRVFMMESTKSKQLLWDFLLKDHMVSWVNLIGIKRPFCETKSNFWYSEIFFSVHFGDISKGYPLEKCQNHHLLFEKLFHISKWPIKAFLKINFNLTLLYEKCPKYGSRCGQ